MALPENPHISVILPVRNGLPYLKDTVESLCAQTYRNFTLVVQDCLSTDGSLAYLRGLQTDFAVEIVSEQDGGIPSGYARAMRRCQGDLVAATACDEMFDATAFAQYVEWFREDPGAVFIYGGSRLFTDEGGVRREISVFQPPEFNFLDYLRQRMCPTTGGAYNRHVLGAEFHFDESLETCADFDLIIRMALLFGAHRIRSKRAVTMAARADRISTTFRPEAHRQMVQDKSLIIRRLLQGPLKEKFLAYLQEDFDMHLHLASAGIVYDIAGDSPAYAEHVAAAYTRAPRSGLIGNMAHRSRFLSWNEKTGVLSTLPAQPDKPEPSRARVASLLPVQQILVSEHMAAQGAKAVADGPGVIVETPLLTVYAAILPVDVRGLDFEKNWYWLHLNFTAQKGLPMLVLGGSFEGQSAESYSSQRIFFQQKLQAMGRPEALTIPLKPCRSAFLAISNATTDCAARIALAAAAVIEMPKS